MREYNVRQTYILNTLKRMRNVCYTILTLQYTYETPTMIKHSTYLHTTLKDKNLTLHQHILLRG